MRMENTIILIILSVCENINNYRHDVKKKQQLKMISPRERCFLVKVTQL